MAARIDALKGLQIHVDVEGEAVIAAGAPHAQPDAGEFAPLDVHARCIGAALRLNTHGCHIVDDAALQSGQQRAHPEPGAAHVDQRIDDELSGGVVGHLPASIDLQHRNFPGREQVRAIRVHAEGEYRLVLEQPDFIRAVRIALLGEALHCAPGWLIGDTAEPSHLRRVLREHHG